MRARIIYKEVEEGRYESASIFNRYKVYLNDIYGFAEIKDILDNSSVAFLTSDSSTSLRRMVKNKLKELGTEFGDDSRVTVGDNHWKNKKKIDNT